MKTTSLKFRRASRVYYIHQNVIFKDNTIINDTPRKNEVSYRGGFWVAYSQNTKIVNNVWIESDYVPKPGVFAETSTKNLLVA
ncbi:MAG: hypothetical protein ACLUKN_08425 [Bacilli bacterium]